MMVLKKLKVDSMIMLVNENKTTYSGVVKAIIGSNFVVQVNMLQPGYSENKKGKKIEYLVGFETEAYRCSSFIVETKVNKEFETLVLSTPVVLMVVERRAFPRLKAVLPVSYYFLHKSEFYREIKDVPSSYWKKTKSTFTIDISGGGASLISYEFSDVAQSTLLKFTMGEEIRVLSSVVRSVPNGDEGNYLTAFKFEDINPDQRKIIIDYVAERINSVT